MQYYYFSDLTTEQMVASSAYNLALNKKATANPTNQEGSEAALTDGINFTDVKTVSGEEVSSVITDKDHLIEVQDVKATGAVRYVRLFYPDSYNYGIQATEIAVLDTDQNATTVAIPKCDDAAGVTVKSSEYNTIEYNITAGEKQKDYVYIVYLDNKTIIGKAVSAGVDYKVEEIDGGKHTLKVVAAYNGGVSDGIVSSEVVVHDPSELIADTKNIANKKNNPLAAVSEVSTLDIDEGINTIATAQVILDGDTVSGQGPDKALRTDRHTGSPQSFVVDLGQYYAASEMDKALIAYSNGNTCASDTTVEFSRDGSNYTEVGSSTGYQCRKNNSGTVDVNVVALNKLEDYKQNAVRFVKVTLKGGVYTWGYVINEFGLMAKTENPTVVPSEVKNTQDVAVEGDGFEKIKYTITAGEGQETGYSYTVKVDNKVINDNAKPGEEYTYAGLPAGKYTMTVYALCELAVMGEESIRPTAPANVTATTPAYNTVTVTWEDLENTEVEYKIYIDGICKDANVPAGTGEKTYSDIRAGQHRIKVSSILNGVESFADEVLVQVEAETTTQAPTTKPTTKPVEGSTLVLPKPTTGQQVTTANNAAGKKVKVGKTKIQKAKAGKGKVSLTLTRVKGAAGYRIKYSSNKKLKKARIISVKKNKATIKKLKKGKVYYFKAQAYVKVKGKKYYGKWSSAKSSKKVK